MASKRVRRVYSPEFKREAVRRMQEQGAAGTTLAQGSRALRVETYRYDPLSRRIRKEMIRDTALIVCTNHDKSSGCRNEVTRTVWDGANILYDVRMPADTATPTGGDGYPGAGTWTGSVGYTNAGGIDAPLDLFKGYTVVVPYTTWRGTYDIGTCPTTKCTDADAYFPLQNSTAFDDAAPPVNGPPNWFGEVIGGQTDGSGYQYKRNRYYDARSGQFTQEDPIGLEGGLNAYGFAAGDPISYSDPMGLTVCFAAGGQRELVRSTERATGTHIELNPLSGCVSSVQRTDASGAYTDLQETFESLVSDPETYTVQFTGQDSYARGRTAFIGIGDYVVFLKTNNSDGTCGTPVPVMGFEHIIAHELLGHVSQSRRIGSTISREAGEHVAVHMENQYLRASGARTLRCRY